MLSSFVLLPDRAFPARERHGFFFLNENVSLLELFASEYAGCFTSFSCDVAIPSSTNTVRPVYDLQALDYVCQQLESESVREN